MKEETYREHLNNLQLEIKQLREQLTAQTEIIMCKDCINADFAGCSGAVCYCMEHGNYMFQWDYCGRAKKEKNE